MHPHFPRRVAASIVVALASIGALLLAEGALRLTEISFPILPTVATTDWPSWLGRVAARYEFDEDLLWRRADYAATLERARRDRPSIVFLGDSCTELGAYDRVALEHLKVDARSGLNVATLGWSSLQGLRQLRRDVLPLGPQLVTVYYGWNDHWLGIYGLEDRQLARLVRWIGPGFSRLAHLTVRAVAAWERQRDPTRLRVSLADFRRNLEAMTELGKRHAVTVLLITAPSAHFVGDEPRYLERLGLIRRLSDLVPLHQSYADAVRAVAAARATPLCDLEAAFAALPTPDRLGSFLPDGIHFTPKGSARAGQLLAACIEKVPAA